MIKIKNYLSVFVALVTIMSFATFVGGTAEASEVDASPLSLVSMTTAKKKGESIKLSIASSNGSFSVEGATLKGGEEYTLTGDNGLILIKGEVTELFCEDNQLLTLNTSKAPKLSLLNCKNNSLESLDLSHNPELAVLNCSGNRISSLNLSGNSRLTGLYCSDNQLSLLDLSKNKKLSQVECSFNQISGKEMNSLIASLPDRTQEDKAGVFRVLGGSEKEKNVCDKEQVIAAQKLGWAVECYDSNAQKWVAYKDEKVAENAGIVTITTAKKKGETIELVIKAKGNFVVEGALAQSEPGMYVLESVDGRVVIKGDVIDLDCSENLLTTLDVTKCPTLTVFTCSQNRLTSLDVTQNALLSDLDCSENQLTTLDVSKNGNLRSLLCNHNQLTALDLTACLNLDYLICSMNRIKNEQMDKMIASLPNLVANQKMSELRVFDNSKNLEQNICTTEQVAAAKKRGWVARQFNKEKEEWVDYEGSPLAIQDVLYGEDATITDIYTTDGLRVESLQPGVNVVRLSNGSVKKVLYTE